MLKLSIQFFGGKGATGKGGYASKGAKQLNLGQRNYIDDDNKVQTTKGVYQRKVTNSNAVQRRMNNYNDMERVPEVTKTQVLKDLYTAPIGTRVKFGANTYELRETKKSKDSSKGLWWYNTTTGNGRFRNSVGKLDRMIQADARRKPGKRAKITTYGYRK